LSSLRLRFLLERLVSRSVVKMPLEAADLEVERGLAMTEGGRSTLQQFWLGLGYVMLCYDYLGGLAR